MEKQVSAVEWFYNQIRNLKVKAELTNMDSNDFIIANLKLLQQAKQMEKEQIIDAWDDGCYQSSDFPKTSDAEKYYNETFKSE